MTNEELNMIKLKGLTQKQKKKADKVAKLLNELYNEGVIIMYNDGGGGSGLSYIRMQPYEFGWANECFYGSREKRQEFDDKVYQNYDCPSIDCGAI